MLKRVAYRFGREQCRLSQKAAANGLADEQQARLPALHGQVWGFAAECLGNQHHEIPVADVVAIEEVAVAVLPLVQQQHDCLGDIADIHYAVGTRRIERELAVDM